MILILSLSAVDSGSAVQGWDYYCVGTESSDDMGSPTKKKKGGSQKNTLSSGRKNEENSNWTLWMVCPRRANGEGLVLSTKTISRLRSQLRKRNSLEEKRSLKEIHWIMPGVLDDFRYLTQEAIYLAKASPTTRIRWPPPPVYTHAHLSCSRKALYS